MCVWVWVCVSHPISHACTRAPAPTTFTHTHTHTHTEGRVLEGPEAFRAAYALAENKAITRASYPNPNPTPNPNLTIIPTRIPTLSLARALPLMDPDPH